MKYCLILMIVWMIFGCKKVSPDSSINTDSLRPDYIAIDSTKKEFIGQEFAKIELEKFLKDSSFNVVYGKVLLNNKDELITFAEPFLFRIYGQEAIRKQRPYEIYLLNEYWIMMGTLPKGYLGGTFSIAVNRKTCEIVGISHGK